MTKITLALTSDIHNESWPIFKEADVLIFAGDFTQCGMDDCFSQVIQFHNKMEELLEQAHKFKQIFVVFGNHDTFAKTKPRHNEILKWEIKFAKAGTNLKFLTNEFARYQDFLFYGSPYTTPHERWAERNEKSPGAFHWTEKVELKVKNIFENTKSESVDVMITHPPVKGILDKNFDGTSIGEQRSKWIYGDIKPKLWVHGHVHESYGKVDVDGTTYVNAAISKSHRFDSHGECNPVIYLEISK